jgi:hypothetical protein
MRIRGIVSAVLAALALLAVPTLALGHAERHTEFPDHALGHVPQNRTSGPSLVVCKSDSAKLTKRSWRGDKRMTRKMLRILKRCKFQDIQAAVNAARNNYRILVFPGVYKEEPSRKVPVDDPKCASMKEQIGTAPGGTGLPDEQQLVPSYAYHRNCPNAQNLIAIVGDSNNDRICDDKCNIEIEGQGKKPDAVLVQGDKKKLNIFRADRADGIAIMNLAVEYSDFNNIYALETNGFRFENIVSRYSREYGVLTFTADNGLYRNIDASYSGDSGVYPGAGPEGHCAWYGIEITGVKSHDNNLGYSGTAGNGVWAHDNEFFHNGTGITTDSFVPHHPGMPQDCSKWENNKIYSNNNIDIFTPERIKYCNDTPYPQRDPKKVCSTFQNPVGTGILIAGGNNNIAANNYIYDNWRNGISLLWVPASVRGENDPALQYDVSHGNNFVHNHMGVTPDGTRKPNGLDFWWDEEGGGNCWGDNATASGESIKSDPPNLPDCPGGSQNTHGNPAKFAAQASCAAWDPATNPYPPGCDWFTLPPEPR